MKKPSGNPTRANKGRYCTPPSKLRDKSTIQSEGRAVDRNQKANEFCNLKPAAKSSELTALRKKAKALGIEKVNRIPKEELKKLVASKEAKSATPDVETETVETDNAEKIANLKEQIKEAGKTVPRGRVSIEKLQAILEEKE